MECYRLLGTRLYCTYDIRRYWLLRNIDEKRNDFIHESCGRCIFVAIFLSMQWSNMIPWSHHSVLTFRHRWIWIRYCLADIGKKCVMLSKSEWSWCSSNIYIYSFFECVTLQFRSILVNINKYESKPFNFTQSHSKSMLLTQSHAKRYISESLLQILLTPRTPNSYLQLYVNRHPEMLSDNDEEFRLILADIVGVVWTIPWGVSPVYNILFHQ